MLPPSPLQRLHGLQGRRDKGWSPGGGGIKAGLQGRRDKGMVSKGRKDKGMVSKGRGIKAWSPRGGRIKMSTL